VVKISDDEVRFLCGTEDLDVVRQRLWHDDLQLMVITSGRKGSRYLTAELEGQVPSFSVDTVDATGAGDAFTAGLLRCLLEDPALIKSDERLREACRFAGAVGALTTTIRGAIPALPDLARVNEFLRQAD
jgi:fructokinase